MADPRLTVVKMLMKMDSSEAYSNLLLDHVFSETDLSERDKAFAAALFYGVLERRLTLDYIIEKNSKIPFAKLDPAAVEILRTGLYQLLYMDSVPESAAVNESVKLCKKLKCFSAQGFVNGMLRSFIRSGKKISYLGLEPEKRLSVEYSCPEWLTEKLIREYGTDFAVKALKASVGRPPVYARVNTLKTTTEKLLAELSKHRIKAEAYPGLENCIRLEKPGDIEKCAPFRQGLFHVQDISSQLCCLTLRPVVNETVLDVCAAPGGKSFTLAELMGNNGKLYSMDLHDMRVGLIEDGASRLGIRIITAMQNDASKFNAELPQADRVLCACGEGGRRRLRRTVLRAWSYPPQAGNQIQVAFGFRRPAGDTVPDTGDVGAVRQAGRNAGVFHLHALPGGERRGREALRGGSPGIPADSSAGAAGEPTRTYCPDENGGDGFFTASFRRVK